MKSLVVKHKDGSFLFALIPGDRQISWPKLRSLVGVNKLSLPPADVALEATGYERGTITPLGSTTAWPVYADRTITGKRISMGAGRARLQRVRRRRRPDRGPGRRASRTSANPTSSQHVA